MKYLIIIILLPLAAIGQNKCDSGYSWMPSMSTSSLQIVADTCLPDSVCKRLWIEFAKNVCGETSFGGMGHYSHNTWVNDSVGCVTKETFYKQVKGKPDVEISKCEYYYINRNSTSCSVYDGKVSKPIPCCGHYHKGKYRQNKIKTLSDIL